MDDRADFAAPTWGWLPLLSFVAALGLLLIALANRGAHSGWQWSEALFWTGLLVMFAPVAVRFCLAPIARRESLGLVVMLGMGLYLVKVLHSPLFFTQHDEFYHWRTANDIVNSGGLFQENPLLPVSALYPGLEIATSALVQLSGMSIFASGVLLIGLARLILVAALYLFYERISRSPQVGGIATLLYMANPNFLFFLAMFKYQSLAIPFAVLVLLSVVRRTEDVPEHWWRWTLAGVLMLGLVVTTHHATSYFLTGFLLLWTVIALYQRLRGAASAPAPLGIALLALGGSVAWTLTVADVTVGYLMPHVEGAVEEVVGLLAREEGAGRELFSTASSAAPATPVWERLAAYSSAGLLLLGLPFGSVVIWRRYRDSAVAWSLALGAALYPLGLALRFTRSGWEIANRSSEFLFVAVGFVVALGLVGLGLRQWARPPLRSLAAAALVLIFLGGFIAGWQPAWRLPGPYLADSGTRSVEAEGMAVTEWAPTYLGRDANVGADPINTLLLGAYGEQEMSITLSGGVNTSWILYAPAVDAEVEHLLQNGQIEYLVVDRRVFDRRQVERYYPETSPEAALEKFDQTDQADRIFDSGNIVIYDVGDVSDGQ